ELPKVGLVADETRGPATDAGGGADAAQHPRRIGLLLPVEEEALPRHPRARLSLPRRRGRAEGLRRFHLFPALLLGASFGEKPGEIGGVAERFADLADIEKGDGVDIGQRALSNQTRAEAAHGGSHPRLVPPVEPVVVLFGERTSRGHRREDLLETFEVLRTRGEMLARAPDDFVGVASLTSKTHGGVRGRLEKAHAQSADEERWIVGPGADPEAFARLSKVPVILEECGECSS